ncbi:MAG: YlxR family protein [Bacilli bacterium]|nr:YlxR family protein [Bacilli bacterium]MDD4406874.1 YlxR family protein [Bacilli bacterium]
MKKIPLRMCVVTKEKLPKKDLIRIVKYNNEVFVDANGKQNGKGCYLKKDIEVINKAQKTKILDKILETNINEEIYINLLSILK